MTKFKNVERIKIFGLLVFLLVAGVGGLVYDKFFSKEMITTTNTSIKQRNFDESMIEFNDSYKKALLSTDAAVNDAREKNDAISAARASWLIWKDVVKIFIAKQPKEYKHTADWGASLVKIAEMLELVNEDLVRNDFAAADKKMKEVGRLVGAINKENNIKTFDNVAFQYYEILSRMVVVKNRAEAIKHLPELKLKFLELKSLQPGEAYEKTFSAMEKAMSGIENSTDKTFPSYQPRLLPAFRDLYLQS